MDIDKDEDFKMFFMSIESVDAFKYSETWGDHRKVDNMSLNFKELKPGSRITILDNPTVRKYLEKENQWEHSTIVEYTPETFVSNFIYFQYSISSSEIWVKEEVYSGSYIELLKSIGSFFAVCQIIFLGVYSVIMEGVEVPEYLHQNG
eukprot:UN24083